MDRLRKPVLTEEDRAFLASQPGLDAIRSIYGVGYRFEP